MAPGIQHAMELPQSSHRLAKAPHFSHDLFTVGCRSHLRPCGSFGNHGCLGIVRMQIGRGVLLLFGTDILWVCVHITSSHKLCPSAGEGPYRLFLCRCLRFVLFPLHFLILGRFSHAAILMNVCCLTDSQTLAIAAWRQAACCELKLKPIRQNKCDKIICLDLAIERRCQRKSQSTCQETCQNVN